MAFLSDENKSDIQQVFADLGNDVRITLYTEHDSPLIVPGRESCESCKDTKALLEEVAALSDKLHLDVQEVKPEHGIAHIPAIVMTADGVKGKVRYFGLPSGYEFSVLLGSLVDVSKGASTDLSEDTVKLLDTVDKDLHFQVFVTPT